MGSEGSRDGDHSMDKIRNMFPDYNHWKSEANAKFWPGTLLRNNYDPSKIILIAQLNFLSEKDPNARDFKQRIDGYKHLEHPNICKLIEHEVVVAKKICNEVVTHSLALEYGEDSLSDIINSRKRSQTSNAGVKKALSYFNEFEAWAVLTQVVQAISYLNEQQAFYGDVQPGNIMITDKKAMKVKIFDPKYTNLERSAYKRKLNDWAYPVILCPDGVRELYSKNIYPNFSPDKAETFAVGVTMVCMLCCEDFSLYYNYDRATIEFEQLGIRLGRLLTAGYSKELVGIIEQCLNDKEYQRPNIQKLSQLVLGSPKNSYMQGGYQSTAPADNSMIGGSYGAQRASASGIGYYNTPKVNQII